MGLTSLNYTQFTQVCPGVARSGRSYISYTQLTYQLQTWPPLQLLLTTPLSYRPKLASRKLQNSLNDIEKWLTTWRINVNETKSVHVTFTPIKGSCPMIKIFNKPIPQASDVKYIGMHLDRRLTWQNHINTKRKLPGLQKSYLLIGTRSQMNKINKILIYKTILKPL